MAEAQLGETIKGIDKTLEMKQVVITGAKNTVRKGSTSIGPTIKGIDKTLEMKQVVVEPGAKPKNQ